MITGYLKYLNYVLCHKYYVALECVKAGLYWQAITHDMSKFRSSEFFPYANHFYGSTAPKEEIHGKTGYYKPTDTGDAGFDFAWLLHQKRNDHHWQFWILSTDSGSLKILAMPEKALTEMVCDWVGAGKAQGYHSPKNDRYFETKKWYEKNKSKMNLHPTTRERIESIIFECGRG